MEAVVDAWMRRASAAVWAPVETDATAWRRAALHAARVAWMAVEGFVADACSMRASALTLASVLAMVPALAASFAYVRGLGWTGERLEALLLERATVLSPEAVSTVVTWVDHISIARLGLLGALFAIASAFSVLRQIESAFDAIWGAPEPRGRVRRTADALVIVVAGPVLLALAASSEAWVRSTSTVAWLEGLGGFALLVRGGFAIAWSALVCGSFASLYLFLPSAAVAPRAAAAGGILAGLCWQFAQGLYVGFQFGYDGYNAVYGAIAQVPVLVLWMWVSWALLLLGAEVAAAMQNLEACGRRYAPGLGGSVARERVALAIAIELADAASARREPPTLDDLARVLATPLRDVGDVFGDLARAGLVHRGGESLSRCFLSLSPGSLSIEAVVRAVAGEDASPGEGRPAVAAVLRRLASARRDALGGSTLADLVDPVA